MARTLFIHFCNSLSVIITLFINKIMDFIRGSFYNNVAIRAICRILIFIKIKLINYSLFTNKLYEDIMDVLFLYKGTRFVIFGMFSVLIVTRLMWDLLSKKLGHYIHSLWVIIALFFSYIDIMFPWGFLALFFILRLDNAFNRMATYYRKRPGLFIAHFPKSLNPKRHMWSRAGQVVADVATNPAIVTLITVGVTATVYKGLQVYDNVTSGHLQEAALKSASETADKDRAVVVETADKDRAVVVETADKDRAVAEEANRQTERANDLNEVGQGLRTPESYTDKWSESLNSYIEIDHYIYLGMIFLTFLTFILYIRLFY
jgi:hypothetical protein